MISPASPTTSTLFASPARPPRPLWKRTLDLTLCTLALPLLAVVTAGVALWIRLFAPGPVFFRQERVGYKGRRFLLYKFRTMSANADVSSHRAHVASLLGGDRPMVKLDAARDNRLIPGGWLLRASGLDELPQLLNVLRGEMSFVGPRPCVPYEYEHYTAAQRARFSSLPGLTGLWQVSGKNRTTFAEMIRLDVEYHHRCSLLLDLRIIVLTLPALRRQIVDTRILRRRPAPRDSATAAAPLPTRQA